MDFDSILADPEMGGTDFIILRRVWTQESGVPELIDLERIFSYGTIPPASSEDLERTPEESVYEPVYLIHSAEPLCLGEEDGDTWTAPDEISDGENTYRVFQGRDWPSHGFWKAWAVQI